MRGGIGANLVSKGGFYISADGTSVSATKDVENINIPC